ncbi:MAG: hypothetical protein PHD76_06340 [Methylacidiphilales bacterium]|nr:hypothetical protein [Candidatus Methylacidiphilales bacterium]
MGKSIPPCLIFLFIVGCAGTATKTTNTQATDTESIQQQVEIERLKLENEKLKSQMAETASQTSSANNNNVAIQSQPIPEPQKSEDEIKSFIDANKTKITEELTKEYRPDSQKILEAYGFRGNVIYYDIDDACYNNGVLYFEQIIIWRKPDNSGGWAEILWGLRLKSQEIVYDNIVEKNLTNAELDGLLGANQAPDRGNVTAAIPKQTHEPGFYEQNKKAIDNAAIGVSAAAATALICDWIHSWFQQAQQ